MTATVAIRATHHHQSPTRGHGGPFSEVIAGLICPTDAKTTKDGYFRLGVQHVPAA